MKDTTNIKNWCNPCDHEDCTRDGEACDSPDTCGCTGCRPPQDKPHQYIPDTNYVLDTSGEACLFCGGWPESRVHSGKGA